MRARPRGRGEAPVQGVLRAVYGHGAVLFGLAGIVTRLARGHVGVYGVRERLDRGYIGAI